MRTFSFSKKQQKRVRHFLLGGFTLVELVISISILGAVTAFVIAKYGSVNQSIFLTNLAYEGASMVRTAQSYGLSVRQAPDSSFIYAYGTHFSTTEPKKIQLFIDLDDDKAYDSGELLQEYVIKQNLSITSLCIGESPCAEVSTLDILFKRPEPDAIIVGCTGSCNATKTYAKVTVSSSEDARSIVIRRSGQISVED